MIKKAKIHILGNGCNEWLLGNQPPKIHLYLRYLCFSETMAHLIVFTTVAELFVHVKT